MNAIQIELLRSVYCRNQVHSHLCRNYTCVDVCRVERETEKLLILKL